MKTTHRPLLVVATLVIALLLGTIFITGRGNAQGETRPAAGSGNALAKDTVAISDLQAQSVRVQQVTTTSFASTSTAVGYIDFDQDHTVGVFAPYQGVVTQVYVAAGDKVTRGQPLFALNSPDLLQAESTLLSSHGTLELTTRVLARTREMLGSTAAAQKDMDQAESDHQAAEAGYLAARHALQLFGKGEAEIDALLRTRKLDSDLKIVSPMSGEVAARNVAVGMLLQPGAGQAPIMVADVSRLWMIANVSEYDLPRIRIGQPVSVVVQAWPGKAFQGTVDTIGAAIDPNTHRIAVRSSILDPAHQLRPQMLASFSIVTGTATSQVAVPSAAVVREGDGTMTVFVTHDGRHFTRRPVQLGAENNGFYPVMSGLGAGEKVATEGALFLSNALALQAAE